MEVVELGIVKDIFCPCQQDKFILYEIPYGYKLESVTTKASYRDDDGNCGYVEMYLHAPLVMLTPWLSFIFYQQKVIRGALYGSLYSKALSFSLLLLVASSPS